MYRDRLRNFFSKYDRAVQLIIDEVLQLEQAYITLDRPRVKDQINDIIEKVAKQQSNISNPQHTVRA
ncbi:MAG: hypothetical protein N2385_08665 [Chloroflexus sp.]|nr:hypothetical protein [Chloroflexus sp.]